MNPDAPPAKEKAAFLGAAKADDDTECRTPHRRLQTQTLLDWYDEARRLALEHERSKNVRDLRAFVRMVAGIMQEIERPLAR